MMWSANCNSLKFDDDDVPDLVDNDGRIVVTAVARIILFADDYRISGFISVNEFNSVRFLFRLMRMREFVNQGWEDIIRIYCISPRRN